ncbi:MAG: ester cyclase [Mesorhizobium amorphae]|nr:MAG: ester cyclase [Mesorhizobium amorphae]
MRTLLAALSLFALSLPAFAAAVDDTAAVALAKPAEIVVDGSLSSDEVAALLEPVDAFYGFWNNGSQALLDQALAEGFTDHTLPPGRPQGPAGPAAASKAFLAAVPDLEVAVVQRLVVGDRVVSHLRFTGHFTGSFMGQSGSGQPIDFIATDILRVRDGRITDNWHLEDNLTFFKQIGLAPKPGN